MANNDLFNMYGKGQLSDPASHAFAITKSDTVNFDFSTRSIYIGGDGNITVVTVNDEVVAFVGLIAGTVLPIRIKRVNSTGTTATNLVGLY